MGKVRVSRYKYSERASMLDDVFSTALRLKSKQEIVRFFKDLLFDSEIIMLGRRLEIARMLLGELTYEVIRKKLHVGVATISAVQFGMENGYRMIQRALQEK